MEERRKAKEKRKEKRSDRVSHLQVLSIDIWLFSSSSPSLLFSASSSTFYQINFQSCLLWLLYLSPFLFSLNSRDASLFPSGLSESNCLFSTSVQRFSKTCFIITITHLSWLRYSFSFSLQLFPLSYSPLCFCISCAHEKLVDSCALRTFFFKLNVLLCRLVCRLLELTIYFLNHFTFDGWVPSKSFLCYLFLFQASTLVVPLCFCLLSFSLSNLTLSLSNFSFHSYFVFLTLVQMLHFRYPLLNAGLSPLSLSQLSLTPLKLTTKVV